MLTTEYWQTNISFSRPANNTAGWYLPFLLLLSCSAAAIDVFSVPSLGVFTANNTGNLVFLAIAAGQVRDDTIKPVAAMTSLAASWAGSAYSGQLGHRVGRARRWFVAGDCLLGAILAIMCAGLYYRGTLVFHDGRTEYVTIALLSFSMGAQNVTTAGTNAPKTITTLVATGAMADFFSDRRIFVRNNRPRDERFIFVIVFFIGGIIAGFAYRYSSPPLALLLSGIFKLLAAVVVLAAQWPTKQLDEENNVVSKTIA